METGSLSRELSADENDDEYATLHEIFERDESTERWFVPLLQEMADEAGVDLLYTFRAMAAENSISTASGGLPQPVLTTHGTEIESSRGSSWEVGREGSGSSPDHVRTFIDC